MGTTKETDGRYEAKFVRVGDHTFLGEFVPLGQKYWYYHTDILPRSESKKLDPLKEHAPEQLDAGFICIYVTDGEWTWVFEEYSVGLNLPIRKVKKQARDITVENFPHDPADTVTAQEFI